MMTANSRTAEAVAGDHMACRKSRLLLLSLAGVLAVAEGRALAGGGAAGVVQSIQASEAADGVTSLVIGVSARPTFTTWKLEQPARVVVDVSGTRLGAVDVPFDAGTFAVGAVSASVSRGDGGPRTRVVFTLRRPADYDVEATGNRISVRVRPHERPIMMGTLKGSPNPPATDSAGRSPAASTRLEAEQTRRSAEAAQLAAVEESRRLAAERARHDEARRSADSARAALESETRRLDEERAKAEGMRRVAEVARREAEAESTRLKEEKARTEAERRSTEAARAAAVAEARRLTDERRKTEEARLAAETARRGSGEGARRGRGGLAQAGQRPGRDRGSEDRGGKAAVRGREPAQGGRARPGGGRGATGGGGEDPGPGGRQAK
jgi:hypothetical protein